MSSFQVNVHRSCVGIPCTVAAFELLTLLVQFHSILQAYRQLPSEPRSTRTLLLKQQILVACSGVSQRTLLQTSLPGKVHFQMITTN